MAFNIYILHRITTKLSKTVANTKALQLTSHFIRKNFSSQKTFISHNQLPENKC